SFFQYQLYWQLKQYTYIFNKKALILDKFKLFALMPSLIESLFKSYCKLQLTDAKRISFSLVPLALIQLPFLMTIPFTLQEIIIENDRKSIKKNKSFLPGI
ncbi:hypothetical protein LRB25_03690, partial [Borreliella burgdorferi]|nr:hypothetical protein [Borreliella burgdorferi]